MPPLQNNTGTQEGKLNRKLTGNFSSDNTNKGGTKAEAWPTPLPNHQGGKLNIP